MDASPAPSSQYPTIISKSRVFPDQKSTMPNLKLTVFDLPMLACDYHQKGALFTLPPFPFHSLLPLLQRSLSQTLSHFPPLAGHLITDSDGHIYITCNDAGVDFIHANANVSIHDILSPTDVPEFVKQFFPFDRTLSYAAHSNPILSVQVTQLTDGVFISCAISHGVIDGTSFWNFFNTFAEIFRGVTKVSRVPLFLRDHSVLVSPAVLRFPAGGPNVSFSSNTAVRETIFSFSREALLKLKETVNNRRNTVTEQTNPTVEISSFQSLCGLVWRAITRARKFDSSKETTFRVAANLRHRLEPKLEPYYFGNALQSIPTYASAGDVVSRELYWCAEQIHKNVVSHDDAMIRRCVEDWEKDPRIFPLGNSDGSKIVMGGSTWFPMYDNDFGWGRPVAIRTGRAIKYDGKMSTFPGKDGGGAIDLEVVLKPEIMAELELDSEFMHYVSV